MTDRAKAHLIDAIRELPQPKDNGQTIDYACWFDARELACSLAGNGEVILSLTIEKGATLTYLLGPQQARSLLVGLQGVLGNPDLGRPESIKPN